VRTVRVKRMYDKLTESTVRLKNRSIIFNTYKSSRKKGNLSTRWRTRGKYFGATAGSRHYFVSYR
jgi:hypothetical protein